jgi:hypothetical protein
MSGSWSPAALATLNLTAGGTGALGTGAHTIAALFQPASGNNSAGLVDMLATSTVVRAAFMDALRMYGPGDFSDGFPATALSLGTWYVAIISKPSGSATYRWAVWPYASDGSGTMTQGTSNNSGNHSDGSAITNIKVGLGDGAVRGNGLIAAVGFWDRQISTGEELEFKTNLLQDWFDLSGGQPVGLLDLENWNGSTGIDDNTTGGISLSSITGTVSSGSNPPSFDFTVSAGGTGIAATDAPGSGLRWDSALQLGVAAGVTVSDAPGAGQRMGRSAETVTIGTAVSDSAGPGIRLGRSADAVVFGVAAADMPTALRAGLGGAESANAATLAPDGVPGGIRWRSTAEGAPTIGVTANDAPGALRWGSSGGGSGVSVGVAVADTPTALRLGASLVGVQVGVVVGDTPEPFRWFSASLAQDLAALDLPNAWRWNSGASGVTVNVPGSDVPDVPRILAPVGRVRIIAPVEEVRV